MDIQFIGEKSRTLTWYITKYETKAERSPSGDVFNDIQSNKPLASRLWAFSLRAVSHRECDAPEAAGTLLGIPLYGSDSETTIKWLDVNEIRNRKLKDRREIE